MRQKLLLALLALLTASTAWADVEINETNFPDANFRNWVLGQTYGADSMLTESEIANVTNIEVNSKNIESLKGIEHFTALKSLSCYYNKLTGLDVSKNTALTNLSCSNNSLRTIDLSGNTALNYLHCQNNQLTTLNVSACKKLSGLECYCNQIKDEGMDSLVESLPNVNNRYMNVIYSYNMGEQNVMTKSQVAAAKAKGWIPLWKPGNNWQEYEGSEDPEPVAGLEINETNFPDSAFCGWLFEQEYGTDGVLTDEEIAGIQSISLYNKGIRSLKGIEHFTALKELYCTLNELDSLDVSGCTGLTSLICQACGLTSLDVSKNTALDRLILTGNQLTSLDVSNHFALTILTCDVNQLSTINLSGCFALRTLSFTSNQIKGAGMDALVESLPRLGDGSSNWMYVIGSSEDEQNEMTKAQVAAAKAKGWLPARWAGYDQTGWDIWEEYSGIGGDSIPSTGVAIDETNFPDANFRNWVLGQTYGADGVLTAEEIAAVTYIRVTNLSIRNLKGIEHFTALKSLDCFQNYLTSLDLSKNTALTGVYCFNNRLTSLNVSGCTALTELDCNENQLARLDVSGCPALNRLYCYKNRIKDNKMDSLIMSLPVVSDGVMNVIFDYNEGNDMTRAQVAAAKAKGWNPRYWDGRNYKWLDYVGSGDPIPDYATLVYRAGGQSAMQMTVKTGNVTLFITPEENWAVDSLTVNGVDKRSMLAGDSLTVSVLGFTEVRVSYRWANDENLYTEDYETGIATIAGENVKVFVIDGQLCIDGAAGRPVRLYTVGGSLVKTVVPQDSDKVGIFNVPAGTYIVQVGNKAAKVMIK